MARLEVLAAAALSREVAGQVIPHQLLLYKEEMEEAVLLQGLVKVVLAVAVLPISEQIIVVLKAVLVVMVQRGLMALLTLVVVVVVMVTLALGAAVLVALALV